MSNYNSSLQSNNIDLQTILNTISELPDTREQIRPTISVNSNGLVVATAGDKFSTYQLAFQPAKTITPTTTSQMVVSSGYYTGGDVTITGDSNLVAENIKAGVSIFGVDGILEDTSDMEDGLVTRDAATYKNTRVTKVGRLAFASFTGLQSINFPVCTTIGSSAFYECTGLRSINFPVCTTIGSSAFYGCRYSLENVYFPACTTIERGAFEYCLTLTTAKFPACTCINTNAFLSCRNLKSFYLLGSSVCSLLGGAAAFAQTAIADGSNASGDPAFIYVPASLLTSYQTATNWAYFSSRFVAYD